MTYDIQAINALAVIKAASSTVDTGVLTLSQTNTIVTAETPTTDDVDTIAVVWPSLIRVGEDFEVLFWVRAATGHTITLKHGVDNIDLPDDTDLDITDDGYTAIYYDGTTARTQRSVSIGSGESNTASNVGTAGVGVYKQKTGVDLEFKKINAGSAKITITDDTGNSEVDVDVDESNIDHGSIAGLTDDDHAQYALLAGRVGGQTIIGGTGSGDDLTLASTSHATKGNYKLQDFANTGRLAIPALDGYIAVIQDAYDSSINPTVDYDVDGGWVPGSAIENTTDDRIWRCLDNTDGAAVWKETTHPMTTAGDVLYHNGTVLVRLAIGTADQVLTVNAGATAPEWAEASSSSVSRALLEDQKAQNTSGGTFTSGARRTRDLNAITSDPDDIVSIWYLDFTSGGTHEIVAGNVIEGATSGATATVFGVELDSGTWAGGDAAGTLWLLDDQAGTFESENLDVGANLNVATIAADAVNNGNHALLAGTYFIAGSAPAFQTGYHQAYYYNVTDTADVLKGSSERNGTATVAATRSFFKGEFTVSVLTVFQVQHESTSTQATNGFGEAANLDTEVYTQLEIIKE